MVNFCAIVGCASRSSREKSLSIFHLSAIVTHSDDKTHQLSKKRHELWLAHIHREDVDQKSMNILEYAQDTL